MVSKVIVVGAGLSGMTTAWELHKAHNQVTVLEARNRVGGRTWTKQFENGSLTELGGEWVFPIEHELRQLGAELRLPIMSHGITYSRRTLNGTKPLIEELNQTTETLRSTLLEMKADGLVRISLDDVYKQAVGSDFKSNALYRRMVTSLTSDPSLSSAEASILHESATAGRYFEDGGRFVDGMQSVCLELERRLPGVVKLESPIKGVSQSASGVEVTLQDGSVQTADYLVLTVPLPILNQLEFDFDFNEKQTQALGHRMMGSAAKMGVPVAYADQDNGVQHPNYTMWSWRSQGFDGSSRIDALSNFAGGPETLKGLKVPEGHDKWLGELHTIRPGLELDGEPILTDWTQDVWTQGAYSAANLDWAVDDIDAFNESSGRVALAGEHTGVRQSLTGAVASGYRAAKVIQKLISVDR